MLKGGAAAQSAAPTFKKTKAMRINPYLYNLLRQSRSPKVVEETDGRVFIGDCLPDCRSYSEPKWLIRVVVTGDDGIQRIFTANGSQEYNQRWTDRRQIIYKPTVLFVETAAAGDIPARALCNEQGIPILTDKNQYIIVL